MGTDMDALNLVWQCGEPGKSNEDNRVLIEQITAKIKAGQRRQLVEWLSAWHPADCVELLVHLPLKQARKLHKWLPPRPAARVIAAINPRLRKLLLEESTITRMVEILDRLDAEDAISYLSEMPPASLEKLLPRLEHADELKQRLDYEKDSAGSIMRKRFVAVPPDWSIKQVTREIRRHAADIKQIYAVYVVAPDKTLLGILRLYDLLLQPVSVKIGDVMRKKVVHVSTSMDQEDVLHLAERYDLDAIPVVDDGHRLIGTITVDELRDVIRLEVEEDLMIRSGIAADSTPEDSALRMVRGRFPWLVVGMVGSVLGALIIMTFESALEEAAILAAFIPLVAATAGNAGIQSSAVAVQSLAYGSVWDGGILRRLGKEFSVALLNGVGISALMGLFILAVSVASSEGVAHPFHLFLTLGCALLSAITLATLMGALMPLILDRMHIDPAVSTGPFITVTNDVVGIFVYFVSATLIYL